MTQSLGFALTDVLPLAHFTKRQNVVAWFLQKPGVAVEE
jgi:hypothetical protein